LYAHFIRLKFSFRGGAFGVLLGSQGNEIWRRQLPAEHVKDRAVLCLPEANACSIICAEVVVSLEK